MPGAALQTNFEAYFASSSQDFGQEEATQRQVLCCPAARVEACCSQLINTEFLAERKQPSVRCFAALQLVLRHAAASWPCEPARERQWMCWGCITARRQSSSS